MIQCADQRPAGYARAVSDPVVMPVAIAVSLAHATVQAIADAEGIHVLHIKGPAVDERLLDVVDIGDGVAHPVPRRSTDADVWVSPADVVPLLSAMQAHEWSLTFGFEDDSAFEHAATMSHPQLGHVDVHRTFPGIGLDPQQAFDVVWADRSSAAIAHYPCAVPSLTAQRLILLLHAARGGVSTAHPDIRRTWADADQAERNALRGLAKRLHAEVALAAATGRLAAYCQQREHDLWQLLSSGGDYSLAALWIARVRAARDRKEAVRTAFRLLVPKYQRLRVSLGRPPTKREVVAAYVHRLRLASGEVRRLLARSRR